MSILSSHLRISWMSSVSVFFHSKSGHNCCCSFLVKPSCQFLHLSSINPSSCSSCHSQTDLPIAMLVLCDELDEKCSTWLDFTRLLAAHIKEEGNTSFVCECTHFPCISAPNSYLILTYRCSFFFFFLVKSMVQGHHIF
jgi:hypothetical protein